MYIQTSSIPFPHREEKRGWITHCMSMAGAQPRATATMEAVHGDVIITHILPCLDGQTLASFSCASTTLRDLISSDSDNLWSHVCRETWPSLDTSRLREVISAFQPAGPRSFFSQIHAPQFLPAHSTGGRGLKEVVSAVDLRYKGNIVFSETVDTADTDTSWFRCAPFRIDLVDSNKVVQTTSSAAVKHPTTDDACQDLLHDLTLSWIIIDPINSRAANLSTGRPVSVERHWLSGEAIVQFSSVLAGGQSDYKPGSGYGRKFGFGSAGTEAQFVMCGIRVRLGGSEKGGEMEVLEVSLVMEDVEGKHLSGEGSLVNLEWGLNGNKMRRYEEFLKKKTERNEREMRREQRLDFCCVGIGAALLAFMSMFLVFQLTFFFVKHFATYI